MAVDIRQCEILALVEKGDALSGRARIGEAVAHVEIGGVTAAPAVATEDGCCRDGGL